MGGPGVAHHVHATIGADDPARIRALNDQMRTTFSGGQLFLTPGIRDFGEDGVMDVLHAVKDFDDELQIKVDLQQIKAARPKIAELLRKHGAK